MARVRSKDLEGRPSRKQGQGRKRRNEPEQGVEPADNGTERKGPPQGMSQRGRLIVVSLMGALLFVFILLALLAPDPSRPQGGPDGPTVMWRLVLLLVPLGIMYGLLWGEKVLKLFKR
jgi:hypothetical protein